MQSSNCQSLSKALNPPTNLRKDLLRECRSYIQCDLRSGCWKTQIKFCVPSQELCPGSTNKRIQDQNGLSNRNAVRSWQDEEPFEQVVSITSHLKDGVAVECSRVEGAGCFVDAEKSVVLAYSIDIGEVVN